MGRRQVLVLGLDSAAPHLVFDRFADRLPVLTELRARGVGGPLRSSDPPITVPAWACMCTGCSPGTLGLYGFRRRLSRAYGDFRLVQSSDVHLPMVWQVIGEVGESVIAVGVPPSYPPYAVQGELVSCLLTPDESAECTYPAALKDRIRNVVPDFAVDVPAYRSGDLSELRASLLRIVDQRFLILQELLSRRDWTFAMSVDMSLDRAQHAFWHHAFADHPHFEPHSPYASTLAELYAHIDHRIGELLAGLDPSGLTVFIVSDHGAQTMVGGFCLNEWLRRAGYLSCDATPDSPTPLRDCGVRWSDTTAWAEGGYCGRVYLNVAGREPQGRLPAADVDAARARLTVELESLCDEAGQPMGNVVLRPEEIYPVVRGLPPDLLVYLGALRWRAIGSLGHPGIFVPRNDSGPDGANHAVDGLWIASGAGVACRPESVPASIIDMAPTFVRALGLDVPDHMEGAPIALGRPAVKAGRAGSSSIRPPFRAVWELTRRCNLRCRHCLIEGGSLDEDELTTQEALALVDELAALGVLVVSLTGGEPLLRDDWRCIAKRVRERGMKLRFSANGHRLDEETLRELVDLGTERFTVSIDGLRATHDRIRAWPAEAQDASAPRSAFDEAVAALDRLCPSPITAGAITAVMRPNLGELAQIHELLKLHGVERWMIQLVHSTGRAKKSRSPAKTAALLLEPHHLGQLAQFLAKASADAQLRPLVHNSIGYLSSDEPLWRRTTMRARHLAFWQGCRCGEVTVGIAPNGDVKGCANQIGAPFVVGNVRDEPLAAIWSDRRRWHWLDPSRRRMAGACESCAVNGICQAGCTALAFSATGTLFDNPYCLRALGATEEGGSR